MYITSFKYLQRTYPIKLQKLLYFVVQIHNLVREKINCTRRKILRNKITLSKNQYAYSVINNTMSQHGMKRNNLLRLNMEGISTISEKYALYILVMSYNLYFYGYNVI